MVVARRVDRLPVFGNALTAALRLALLLLIFHPRPSLGFPTPSSVGVDPGRTLVLTNISNVSLDNTILEGFLWTDQSISILADNVTLRNCRFNMTSTADRRYVIAVGGKGLILDKVEILVGNGSAAMAVGPYPEFAYPAMTVTNSLILNADMGIWIGQPGPPLSSSLTKR